CVPCQRSASKGATCYTFRSMQRMANPAIMLFRSRSHQTFCRPTLGILAVYGILAHSLMREHVRSWRKLALAWEIAELAQSAGLFRQAASTASRTAGARSRPFDN